MNQLIDEHALFLTVRTYIYYIQYSCISNIYFHLLKKNILKYRADCSMIELDDISI